MCKLSSGCYIIDEDYNLILVNDTAAKLYPTLKLGDKCYSCLMGLDAPCPPCPIANGIKGPKVYMDPIRHVSEVVDAVELNENGVNPMHALVFYNTDNFREIADALAIKEEVKQLQERVAEVERDSLTGLYTKEAFFFHGEEILKQYPEEAFDFTISRIDGLTAYRHQFGPEAAERLLALVGRILLQYKDDTMCLAYLGEGYFCSLTKYDPKEIRKAKVDGFHKAVYEQAEYKEFKLRFSIFVRVPRELSLEYIYEKTRYAVVAIEGSSKQDYIEYSDDILARMLREERIERQFDDALENGEFRVWFQPKYDVQTRRMVGAEALVRWQRPDGVLLSPGEFIPVLEKTGKIRQLDEAMFRKVCRFQKKLRDAGFSGEIPISVNLSRASIFGAELGQELAGIAAAEGVRPALVPIEITESAAVRMQSIKEIADGLVGAGFPLHLDDFGSGYSSLASMLTVPFEAIKLDKSLIDFIGTPSGESLVKHTIAFAKEAGKITVAEGVETLEQFMFLKFAGCDAIQGYYFSRPVPKETFLEMLHRQELDTSE